MWTDGAVQSLFKNDPTLVAEYGEEAIRDWRRTMHGKPPALTTAHPEWQPPPAPVTESLADCQQRVLECFRQRIAPALFDEADPVAGGWIPRSDDRTVVVVAHSNTIRSLMAHFDGVADEAVPRLHVPNSVPILYRFERGSQRLLSTKLQSAAGGSHARWLLSPENHVAIREAIQPGGMLTRAVLDSWVSSTGRTAPRRSKVLTVAEKAVQPLTVAEIEAGITAMLSQDVERPPSSDAVIAVAKQVVRELPAGATVTVGELEALAAKKIAAIAESVQQARELYGTNEADLLHRDDCEHDGNSFYTPLM